MFKYKLWQEGYAGWWFILFDIHHVRCLHLVEYKNILEIWFSGFLNYEHFEHNALHRVMQELCVLVCSFDA